jgi:hypothetical protein
MNEPERYQDQGPRIAAFLLVIPGCALAGVGIGLLSDAPGPWTLIGTGTGATIWGLIVALRRA